MIRPRPPDRQLIARSAPADQPPSAVQKKNPQYGLLVYSTWLRVPVRLLRAVRGQCPRDCPLASRHESGGRLTWRALPGDGKTGIPV